MVCAAGVGVDHFDRHVLLTAALIHGAGRDLIALSGSHDSRQRAAGRTPLCGAVVAVQGGSAAVRLFCGQGQTGTHAFPGAESAFKGVVHQLFRCSVPYQTGERHTADCQHTCGDGSQNSSEFHVTFLPFHVCFFVQEHQLVAMLHLL